MSRIKLKILKEMTKKIKINKIQIKVKNKKKILIKMNLYRQLFKRNL